jgi:hypothetical protein
VVENGIADFTTIDQDLNRKINFDTSRLGTLVPTPFGNKLGYQLAHFEGQKPLSGGANLEVNADFFCVECSMKANLNLRGKVVFILSRLQFEEGFVEVTGNMAAALGLGVVADFTLSKEFVKQIQSIPLQPFSVPNVFVVGPKFDLSVGVEFQLELEGQILAGVQASWPSISAHLDIIDSSKSFATGFRPTITPALEVESSITLKSTVFLEGALGIGIDVGNGAFDKSVSLVDRPGIFFSAGAGASFSIDGGLGGFGANDCRGVNVVVGFSNEVFVDILDVDLFRQKIDQLEIPIDSRCFTLFKRDQDFIPLIGGRQDTVDLGETTFDGGIVSNMYTRDNDRSFRIRYSPNGNTYAVAENKAPEEDKNREWSGWFATDPSGTFVFGDSHGRLYHAYHDTLLQFGVSRLRLHKPDRMPRTAIPIIFASVVDDSAIVGNQNSTGISFANSTSTVPANMPVTVISNLGGEIYFPIICIYASQKVYAKLFLAEEIETGVATLMSNKPEIINRITGGQVQECGYVPLTNGIQGSDIGSL